MLADVPLSLHAFLRNACDSLFIYDSTVIILGTNINFFKWIQIE